MQDGGTWVFVEVRYRRHARYGHALESIDLRKRRRLLYAASRWLHGRSLSIETADCRFDVLAITGNQLQWLTNAFDANGDA
ncbi:putative endonuclease [Leminorella grimontii ATCC 33999 = DSM 5078]|nr:putative endonuclease [Leminorella grimontii ATCC 33999 = DSM 5078]